MKAPEHFSPPPENGTRSINYSMLPPDKLPNWLLEKKSPEKIQNFSMRPPGSQERVPSPTPEERIPEPDVVSYPAPAPPASAEQPTVQLETPTAPELTAPDAPSVDVEIQPEPAEIVLDRNDTPAAIEQETPQAPVVNTAIAEETIPDREPLDSAIHHPVAPEQPMPVPSEALVFPAETPAVQEWRQPPAAPVAPQRPPAHKSRPAAYSLGDWIHNNSTTAMIIVVAIIAFVVLIVALLEFAVI
jgi:hypothetical protein